MTKATVVLSALALGALPLVSSGCYVESGPAATPYAEPAPAPQEVVVENPPPPPPPVYEAPPAPPPQPGMVYVQGNHRWDGHKYVWEKGHYDRPPRPNARYEAGHWEPRGHGKVWVNARWM
ncbi:MAG TPA: hypothetical protein VH142_20925 [Polyangiaceae bacterium]|nr:hypothetical protein [Polyangiaceae bacterium]